MMELRWGQVVGTSAAESRKRPTKLLQRTATENDKSAAVAVSLLHVLTENIAGNYEHVQDFSILI